MRTPFTRRAAVALLPDWLCGAALLLIPALYNSFPLVTSDSGAYIGNAYELSVPLDRSLGYSVFVRLSSFGVSMWGVVIVQALIISVLLLYITRHYLGGAYRRNIFLAIMLLLGVATSAGWFAGQLMPDIFTAVLLLACCILTAWPPDSRLLRQSLYVLVFFCIMMHNSNLVIALLLGAALFFYGLRKKDLLLRSTSRGILIAVAAGWVTLSLLNLKSHHGFRPSAASHVFLMCRMCENGILETYLRDRCPVEGDSAYKLCAYRDRLPNRQWDFMWAANSPLNATGGWEGSEKEYNRIILRTLITPKYLAMHVIQNAQATMRQLPLIYISDGLQQYGEGSSPYTSISTYDHHELKEFNSAMQQLGSIKWDWWNALITCFTLLIGTFALLQRRSDDVSEGLPHPMRRMIRVTVLFLLINAAVTATFSTVVGRFESRVFWVVPFLCMLYLVKGFFPKPAPTDL